MEDFAAFARLVEALRPWLGHLVIVGGWAHRLYRFHPLATAPAYLPLLTRDTDVALSIHAPLEGDISAALENAGFHADFSGEHTPPVTRYRLGEEDGGFYAEFLTPLQGDGFKRDGDRDVTVSKAGITAQKFRHLELLLTSPSSLASPRICHAVRDESAIWNALRSVSSLCPMLNQARSLSPARRIRHAVRDELGRPGRTTACT